MTKKTINNTTNIYEVYIFIFGYKKKHSYIQFDQMLKQEQSICFQWAKEIKTSNKSSNFIYEMGHVKMCMLINKHTITYYWKILILLIVYHIYLVKWVYLAITKFYFINNLNKNKFECFFKKISSIVDLLSSPYNQLINMLKS